MPADPRPPGPRANTGPAVLKILIAGGFGVGKTTCVGAVSDITPIATEEYLTHASTPTDRLEGIEAKNTTTVAFDFGRVALDALGMPMELMLFGTPGQDRFKDLWADLARGAVGAVVLADTRRLDISFDAVTFCEHAQLPFIVAVNEFDGAHRYPPADIRHALGLAPHIPLTTCDARAGTSVAATLMRLVDHALASAQTTPTPSPSTLDAR
ncbi:GTP-binding protein [Streptomyces olivaceus]|uniref:GTP-binding protein n=1 Tax=Streptomyces olivaceus TaxID=47716 RepID=UPI0037B708EB